MGPLLSPKAARLVNTVSSQTVRLCRMKSSSPISTRPMDEGARLDLIMVSSRQLAVRSRGMAIMRIHRAGRQRREKFFKRRERFDCENGQWGSKILLSFHRDRKEAGDLPSSRKNKE